MISRRVFAVSVLSLAAMTAATAFAQSPTPNDPVAIVNAIYTRVSAGKGDGGGDFVTADKAAKAKYLSKSLIALWAKADAHTPKGDVGPVDFDPVTNSQDPDVKSFNAVAEKQEANSAVIAVTIAGHGKPSTKPADDVIRYTFVRDGTQWKIDDISGASDGEAWSIRDILRESLKEVT